MWYNSMHLIIMGTVLSNMVVPCGWFNTVGERCKLFDTERGKVREMPL